MDDQKRRASIVDVARLANVSPGTVSRYFNRPEMLSEETKERISAGIKVTGYKVNSVARSFRQGRTGLIIAVASDFSDPFYGDMLNAIGSVISNQGYRFQVALALNEENSGSVLEQAVFSRQADGVLLLGNAFPNGLRRLLENDENLCPIVVAGQVGDAELEKLAGVRIDNRLAFKEATDYLISLGHQYFGFIRGENSSILYRDSELGVRESLSQSGIDPSFLIVQEAGSSMDEVRRATRRLLNLSRRPDCLICANDDIALAALAEIRQSGLSVPDNISVIGCDDIRYASISEPPLTTIAQSASEIGERATYRLLNALKNPDMRTGFDFVQHKLIIRGTTGRPSG